MIKPEYVRLSVATEMIGTDVDTLLLAAAGSQITIYWYLNQSLRAQRMRYDPDGAGRERTGAPFFRLFTWVPLNEWQCGAIAQGASDICLNVLGPFDADAPIRDELYSDISLTLKVSGEGETLFMRRADVEALTGGAQQQTTARAAEPDRALALEKKNAGWPEHDSTLFNLLPKVLELARQYDEWPKQAAFVEELKQSFNISETEAKALDAVTRPDSLRRKNF